ncbi:D-inositol-3-phosphate glycosyltransferase [Candidatus Lokiarchaeum ossiferum]|uniref:D-inositol-3-phosphate glycosyltransferase n=1 Tax=Candidatus Lokiarchaeum ossiferum TaxID=2951803 RepID=A0ABY6HUY6_9ARCH|nr:D-inositol-3-phosphate glycosyltransferase [Candidatus Lokiarchaeum sp. B-35]
MKILMFPTRFYPAISGGDFYLERLGRELKRKQLQNNQVQFITTDAIDFAGLKGKGKIVAPNHRFFSRYKNLQIKRYRTHPLERMVQEKSEEEQELYELCHKMLKLSSETIEPLMDNGPIIPELNQFLLNNNQNKSILYNFKPEIMHCTYLPYTTLLYCLLLGKKMKIPTCVTPFLHENNFRYKNQELYKILDQFDAILACTNHEKMIMIKNGVLEEKIHVLPMGVDSKRFQQDHKKLVRRLYSIENPVVLFCGYKNYEKGALTLLNTIPLIIKENSAISFIFIGPPTTAFNYTVKKIKSKYPAAQILNLTPENLTGIYDKKKIGAFQLAKVFCMPSRSDAYGIVFLESWASGTPVIAANIPAMHEVIDNQEDGILVEFDNPKALKKIILDLINNPEKAQTMGKKGQNKVEEQNRWDIIAKQTLKIYQKLINSRELNENN